MLETVSPYCKNCQRRVNPKRKIGAGTLLMVLLTGGLWLLAIPFYAKRCPICYNPMRFSQKEYHMKGIEK